MLNKLFRIFIKLVQLVFYVTKERHIEYGILRNEFHFVIERMLEFFFILMFDFYIPKKLEKERKILKS